MSAPSSPWQTLRGQVATLAWREAGRTLGGKQVVAMVLLASMPVLIAGLRALFLPDSQRSQIASGTAELAQVFHYVFLRLVVFFGCAFLFVRLFRGEILERSLHFVFLAPIERRIVVLGKYLGGLVSALILFLPALVLTWVLYFLPYGSSTLVSHLTTGPGARHLLSYLIVVAIGTVGYGALFLLAGLFFRNPMVPAVVLLGWEMLTPFMPTFLKGISVTYYLSALYPVPVLHGPFALMSKPWPAPLAVLFLLAATAVLLWVAGRKARRLEITYSVD